MAATVEVIIEGRDNFSSTLGNFGNIMTGIKSTIDLVAGAFNSLVGFGSQFVNEAIEGQDAIAELEQVLKATGGAAGLTSEELQGMAGELQQVTRFSDETIMSGQSMLLTFRNIGEDTFPRATEAMLDMAEMFGSVDTAAVQLGKALNDPIAGIGALSRIGIQFTDEQKEMIENFMETGDVAAAQNIILKEVEMQIGGLAIAMGDTFAGKVEIFKNRIGEIKEVIGTALLPILEILIDKFMEWMPLIEEFGGMVADAFVALAEGLETGDFSGFMASLEELRDFVFGIFQGITDDVLSSIDAQVITDWVVQLTNELDAKLADAIEAHDWTVSGDAFGDALAAMLSSDATLDSAGSQFIPALGQAIGDWLLGAMGVASWHEAEVLFVDILQYLFIEVPLRWIGEQGLQAQQAWISFWADLFTIESINNALQDLYTDLGIDIENGLLGALDSIELGITDWIRTKIIDPVKQVLGIASPSTVFMEIGRDIVLGLIAGFSSAIGGFISLVSAFIDTVLGIFAPFLEILGIDISGLTSGTAGATGDATGTLGGTGATGSHTTGTTTTGTGTVVNQYFSGATINVGSWDEIAYDCIYPNPFVEATSGQLNSGTSPFGNGTTPGGGR